MLKSKIALFIEKVKQLNGDPHYVAFGMAIGVFIAITPTIPFHTILAISLAVILKASKLAAVLGVWACNPFTVVFLYFACYKTGYLFFDGSAQELESIHLLIENLESDMEFGKKISYLIEFMKTKMRTFMIMNAGGLIIGLPAGVAAYVLTKIFVSKIRKESKPA